MKNTTLIISLAILFAFHVSNLFGQERISDWRSSTNISSDPNGFIRFGDKVYFAATDFDNGTSVWVTDGKPEGTIIFQKGENYKSEFKAIAHQDTLYYIFDRGVWKMALDGKPEKVASISRYLGAFNNPWIIDKRIWFSLNKSYDINSGRWESTSNFENQQEDGYPYDYGRFSFNKDFIAYQYYSVGIPSGSGRSIEIRDSSNKAVFYEDNNVQWLRSAFESSGKRFALLSYDNSLRLAEFRDSKLAIVDDLNTGFSTYESSISEYSDSDYSMLVAVNPLFQSRVFVYKISAESIEAYNTIRAENETWRIISIDHENLYVLKTDRGSLQNSFWEVNINNQTQNLLSKEIVSGQIAYYSQNTFSVVDSNDHFNNYVYSQIIKDIRPISVAESISGSAYLNDIKITAKDELFNRVFNNSEPYVFGKDTLLLKNIMTNGGVTDLFPFKNDGKVYFAFNEAEKGFTIHKLDAINNSFHQVFSSPERLTVLYSDLYFRFENKKLQKVATFGRSEKGEFILLKKSDEDFFEIEYADFAPERAFFNSAEDVIYSGEGELLKYSVKDKVAKTIWSNGGFNTLQDPITNLRYKDYIFKVTPKNIYAFNTVSENLTVLTHNSETTPFLWQNRLISVSNDSLNLYEIDENFKKRTLAIGVDFGNYLRYQFSDSTFTIFSGSKVLISNGTCEETRVFQVLQDKYEEVNLINSNIASDNYALYKSISQDLMIYSLGDSILVHLPEFDLYGSIKTNKAIYYLNPEKDALKRLDFKTGKSTTVSTFGANFQSNRLTVKYQNQKTGMLYFVTSDKLFKIDLETEVVSESQEPSLGIYSEYISEGSGRLDFTVIRGRPYSLDKTSLSITPIQWDTLNYLRSYNSWVQEFKNHWLLNYEKGVMLIDKYSFEQQIFNLPTGVSSTYETFVQNKKLYAVATNEKYGYQVWFIAEIEGFEEIEDNEPHKSFTKLPENKCFQPLALEEPDEVDILVYPNPNEGRFNVQLPKGLTNVEFEIYQTTGRKIDFESRQIDNSNYTFTIDKTGLQSLILKVISPEKTISKKVHQSE